MPNERRSSSMGDNTPPTSHTTSPTYGLKTRRTVQSPITQEAIEALPNRVKDAPSSKTFLESKLLCHIGQPYTINHLILALFQITQMSNMTPVPVTAAIRAVAFVLKELDIDNTAEMISQQVLCSLNTKLMDTNLASMISKQVTNDIMAKLVDHVVAAISLQVTSVHNISQSLTSTLDDTRNLHTSIGRERTEKEDNIKTTADRIEDAADALYESVETYQKALHTLTPSLDATQEKIDQLSTQISRTPTPTQGTVPPSYSSVAATYLPPKLTKH
ncbi:uncharacterized protein EDB93DRAFT_1252501 [Suillus bovinus]|uniref:uncharacterized protein n=1 Tax=Suillus bovinus TaxID=48563 RepID=UPI001B87F776|nr:uncharacterized protein EDB93DRAFT_1252501 [Suillus bovinus]KAG2141817.1 hypothetical protein EDB93DRAFT_1252501 [Suillus bovinus]